MDRGNPQQQPHRASVPMPSAASPSLLHQTQRGFSQMPVSGENPNPGAGSRTYMPPLSHQSPTASSSLPNPPQSARSAGNYHSGSMSAHSQSSFAPPGAPAQAAPAQQSIAGTNSLPPINSPYVRSPSFTSAQTASIPPIKSPLHQPQQQQQQHMAHSVSSPLHGSSSVAPNEGTFSLSASHTPVPRMHPQSSISSPGARAGTHQTLPQQPSQTQSPNPHHHTSSVPPQKQAQSPRVHRTASVQSPSVALLTQPVARPLNNNSTPRVPPASAHTSSVPPLGASQSLGAVPRLPPASGPAVSSGSVQAAGSTPISAPGPSSSLQQTQPGVGAAEPLQQIRQPQPQQPQPSDSSSARPLNVSDALSYLDLVKSQFRDRPEVYNQFLEIMKEFKSHAIDTPGVIERVSQLFYGSPNLIQGFNTFLPPGYRIECSDDPTEGVRVTTPSGSIIPDMNRRIGGALQEQAQGAPQSPLALPAQQPGSSGSHAAHNQAAVSAVAAAAATVAAKDQYAPRRSASYVPQGSGPGVQSPSLASQGVGAVQNGISAVSISGPAPPPIVAQTSSTYPSSTGAPNMPARSLSVIESPSLANAQRPRQVPLEFDHAINYVNKIKMRFAAEPDRYKEFLEILQTYQRESRPIQDVYAQVHILFASAPDLLDEFKQFLPDTSESAAAGSNASGSPTAAYVRPGAPVTAGGISTGALVAGLPQRQLSVGVPNQQGAGSSESVAGGRLPPVGNFTPVSATAHGSDSYADIPAEGGMGALAGVVPQQPGMVYDSKNAPVTPSSNRKRRGMMGNAAQVPGSGPSKRRAKGSKADGSGVPLDQAGGYGQSRSSASLNQQQIQMQGQHSVQQPANPATATPDELAFFERVKRFIGQPASYNEFLKLLNLYNQQILDPKTLVERAESFIGDDLELFGWFKQFVGFDEQQQEIEDSRANDEAIIESIVGPEPGPYIPPEEVAKTLRPAKPKAILTECKAYGPSYRLLPESSIQSKCSGRDSMCFEVLNDRWASHPTWASEDTEFVHHKKSQFEEALFRSEEDRHEMDIEIDTNLSVIRQLTPIAQQIEQMDPEKQMQLTLPENFWGMSEALPRRALRKVYDTNRAIEIIKAMHTHPAVAIPIVLKRLKQKDEEWRRQRRELAKVWRESDAKNYYRSLDHQSMVFKSADRKNISPKHLVTEIETRRREQQNFMPEDGNVAGNGYSAASIRRQNRKVASALRHRYQLEYRFSEATVIADVINSILAHVGRHNSQFAPSEKEVMERFFHELFGGLFGVENSMVADGTADGSDDEKMDSTSAEPETNGVGSNGTPSDVKPGESEESSNNPVNGTSDDLKKDGHNSVDADPKKDADKSAMCVDKASDDSAAGSALQNNGTDSAKAPGVSQDNSKPSTPGLISSRSWIQIGLSNRDASATPALNIPAKSMSRAFYTNSNYYVFLRLFQILYERFDRLRELGPEYQNKAIMMQQGQSAATKLGLRPQLDILKQYDLEHTDYYTIFLELVDQFLQGQLDTNVFEEAMRVMYGINAYKILTVDKVVQAISKNIQHLISDTRCVDILELFTTLPPVHEQSPLRSHIAYRMKVEALVGADEHVFRIDYIYDSQTMTIQLLRREDITLDEAVTEEERWAYYVDSYVLFEPTEGVPRLQQSRPRPYLPRHLHADEGDYVISSRSNLEIKIAVNTYKLCFLTGTEDIYANHTRRAALHSKPALKKAYEEQWDARTRRWHELVKEKTEGSGDGDGNAQDGTAATEALTEWWKQPSS
ncbi:hypothetical protein EV177_004146 [Coemansia sp. RSA 1804]|nr:hypothetical protein EV177_004146 [Coemansia sp. RSA 1804]